jgi:hypothetical protein
MEVRMIKKGLVAALVFVFSMGAGPAVAQFLAADLIYLPAVAHTNGEGDSRWRSDLFVTNAETDVDIDVALVFLPTGGASNTGVFQDRESWLGGREGDGFGFINSELANIPPGGTVVLRDPIGEYWGTLEGAAGAGGMIVFAYEANTLEDDGTRVFKNAIVNSRAFTPSNFFVEDPDNEGEYLPVNGTYGMTLPGVAWYNLADPSAVGEEGNLSFLLLTGAKEDARFRYNVGVVNASDPLTTITVSIQPFQGNGEPYLNDNESAVIRIVTLQPNAHVQYNDIFSLHLGLGDTPDDTILKIGVVQWSSGSSDPIVGMTVYGTMVDNRTQDPTSILPAFAYPYNVDCQWPSPDAKSTSGGSYPRVSRRPVEIPSR